MADMKEGQTPEERENIQLVTEYMTIAYDPERASAQAVAHLCVPKNRLIAATTFLVWRLWRSMPRPTRNL